MLKLISQSIFKPTFKSSLLLARLMGKFSLKNAPDRKPFNKLKSKHIKYFKKILQSPEIMLEGIDSFNETYFREYKG